LIQLENAKTPKYCGHYNYHFSFRYRCNKTKNDERESDHPEEAKPMIQLMI